VPDDENDARETRETAVNDSGADGTNHPPFGYPVSKGNGFHSVSRLGRCWEGKEVDIRSQDVCTEIVNALSLILDLEEDKKLYHAWRVALIATVVAKEIEPALANSVYYASLLHDIGAMGAPNHIVHYLTVQDQVANAIIHAHPLSGTQIVSSIPGLVDCPGFVLFHHEWWNGHGYPAGRSGEKIPKGAQLIRIADGIDVNMRVQERRGVHNIQAYLSDFAGAEFSPELANAVSNIMKMSNFYEEIRNEQMIEPRLDELRKEVGPIPVESGIDAVGTTLQVFAQVIDTKHVYTAGHSERVSKYALLIAVAMELGHDAITSVKWSGYVHDLGKVAVSRTILDKTVGLDKDEWGHIRMHPVLTKQILSRISSLETLSPIAGGHHERFDGGGYPEGLSNGNIPIGARILAVADAFDAMTSDRAYRKALGIREAVERIKKEAGTQFDPYVVDVATPILENLNLKMA
jgi:HD-GYP domain-containing protein (c-di-GMP phosphodiesterase class II)